MVYTLGESLLDIIISSPDDISARPGGGMLNTAVSLGRCGIEVSMISELGDDDTARLVISFLESTGVKTRYIKKYYRQNTSVAVAFLDKNKVPSFSIHKSYPDSRRLVSPEAFTKEDILFFGSLYSLDGHIRGSLREILVNARQGGALLCYDPNIRKHNLRIPEIRQAMLENLALADIIKASEEDLHNMFGKMSPEHYLHEIRKVNPEAIFIMTRGEQGAIGYARDTSFSARSKKISIVSTIGAGDAFNAGIVYALKKELSFPDLEKMIKTGIAFSAEVCSTMDNYVGTGFEPS